MALMFERLIFGGAHIEVLIKAWLILKVGLMDARAQWLNKAQARARLCRAAQSTIDPHFFNCIIITLLDGEVSDLVTVQ